MRRAASPLRSSCAQALPNVTTTELDTPAALALPPGAARTTGILRYLTIAGLAFVALVMTLEPDVGFAAPPAAQLLFWALQVAAGLFVLQSVLYLLTRRYGASRVPSWALVLLSGVLGAVVLAPIYWLIGEGLMESWLGYPARPDEDGDSLVAFAGHNPLLREYMDIVGPVATAWALICLPRLHWLVPPLLHARTPPAVTVSRPARPEDDASAETAISRSAAPGHSDPTPRSDTGVPEARRAADPDPTAMATSTAPGMSWRERLPAELGKDVIAVASELQYLRVWTSRGCALVLGALADVESEDAARGLRVHRSWWVACEHVVSVRRTSAGTICLMSDGRRVPVSRRRSAEVLARFGNGAEYRVSGTSKAVADTDLC